MKTKLLQQSTPLYGEQRPILKAAFMRTESELGRSLWNEETKLNNQNENQLKRDLVHRRI